MELLIHPSARKHGFSDEDIGHAVKHAMSIDDELDDLRLYLGPARNSELIEVVTVAEDGVTEMAIHAMRMRPKYRWLPAGS
jgi:hypothetical protein